MFEEGNFKTKFKNDIYHKVEISKNKTIDEVEGWKKHLDDSKSIDVCNRLYTNGIREKVRHENYIKAKQLESTEMENQSLKFKPDLNLTEAKNKNLLKNQDRSGIERLSHWKAHKESKIHQVGKQIEEESMIKNNYQPEINKTSKSIMNKAQASVNRSLGRPEDAPFNRHEQLY